MDGQMNLWVNKYWPINFGQLVVHYNGQCFRQLLLDVANLLSYDVVNLDRIGVVLVVRLTHERNQFPVVDLQQLLHIFNLKQLLGIFNLQQFMNQLC